MAATSALLSAAFATNLYLRSVGRSRAAFFPAAVVFNTALILGYLAAPQFLAGVEQFREYAVFHVVLTSALIGFFGVPLVLQLLLFLRESFGGATISDAFWNSHRKLILGALGTNFSWALLSSIAGLAIIITRIVIEWIQRSWH